MADVITRLKLESGEYDSKIKRAVTGLQQMENECRKVNGTLAVLEKDQKEYVQSLGQMQTVATTVRGKLSELTQAYTELRVQYERLSEEEKNGDFGKALSSSLDQLKVRINDTKTQLNTVNTELGNTTKAEKNTTSGLDGLTSALGINAKSLVGWGAALTAGKAALDVAKDAFMQSESNIDEWGRTLEGAKGAYNIFLDTLNNGNWSNFFQNLETAIKGGRDLYDVFDRLGSIKSNNQAAIALVQQQIAELRLAKQQGKNVDDQLKAATARLAQLQRQSINAGKDAGNKAAFEVIRNGVNSVGGAGVNDATIKYVVDRIMKNGQSEFDKYNKNYQILQQKGTRTTVMEMDDGMGGKVNKYTKTFDISLLTKEQQKQYAISKAVTEGETRIQRGINAYAQAVQEGTASAREEFKGNRYALQGAGGGKGGTKGTQDDFTEIIGLIGMAEERVSDLQKRIKEAPDETTITVLRDQLKEAQADLDRLNGKELDLDKIFPDQTPQSFGSSLSRGDQMAQQIKANIGFAVQDADMSTLRTLMEATIRNGIEGIDIPSDMLIEQIMGEGLDIPDTYWKELEDQINEKLKELGVDPISLDLNTGKSSSKGKNTDKTIEKMSKGISGLNGVLGGVEKMGLQIPAEIQSLMGVIEGAMMIIQGVSTIIGVTQTTATTANTVALTALTAAVWANTASSFIPFATGGIVPHAAEGYFVGGTHMSGDVTPIMANAGELVLNRAQQGNLASQMADGAFRYLNLTAIIRGEQIRLALNNNGRRTGRGEYVQTNRR